MPKLEELQNLSLPITFEVDDSFDSDKFIRVNLRVMHDQVNPNKSEFELADMEKAKDSMYNIPILANVIVDENGEVNFGGHDMELEESKINSDEMKLIYKEQPIGVIPESCNYTIEKYNDKNYVYCQGYIYRGYSNYAEDIINRDSEQKISMEIIVDSYEYNAKKKCYKIKDYRYQGVTFLNKNFGTGMLDARATTGTFSEDDSKEKFIIMMQELKDTLNQYNIDNSKEGGNNLDEKVIEILATYNLTPETISFSVEGMSFEEIETKLKELYSQSEEEKKEENKEPEKFVKSFELSHGEIRYALYQLLSPIESTDNEWYFIDQVYDDRFEYMNWEGTKIYRQGYEKDGDAVTFTGERVELFQERLTKEEKDALDKMRGDFELLKSDKEKLENDFAKLKEENDGLKEFKLALDKAEKEEVFSKFEGLSEEDVSEIKEHISEYSIEQIEEKLFAIWGKKKMELESGKKFSKKETKKDKLAFALTIENKDENQPIYADIVNKYKK